MFVLMLNDMSSDIPLHVVVQLYARSRTLKMGALRGICRDILPMHLNVGSLSHHLDLRVYRQQFFLFVRHAAPVFSSSLPVIDTMTVESMRCNGTEREARIQSTNY